MLAFWFGGNLPSENKVAKLSNSLKEDPIDKGLFGATKTFVVFNINSNNNT